MASLCPAGVVGGYYLVTARQTVTEPGMTDPCLTGVFHFYIWQRGPFRIGRVRAIRRTHIASYRHRSPRCGIATLQ